LHLPSWGAFQRSLALLVHYRSRDVFSLGRRCRPHSRGISNPRYSGTGARRTRRRYGAVTLCRAPFQGTSRRLSDAGSQSEHHIAQKASVWTVSLSLAVTHDIPFRFLFLPVLRCFNSRRSPLRAAIAVGIPIRKSWVLRLRAAPPGLSQLGTSFVSARAEPSTRRLSSHAVRSIQWNESSGRPDRTYTRCHLHARRWAVRASTLPTRACTGWCIGLRTRSSALPHLRDTDSTPHRYGPAGIRTQGLRLAKAAIYH
jgi:hypothetical protein